MFWVLVKAILKICKMKIIKNLYFRNFQNSLNNTVRYASRNILDSAIRILATEKQSPGGIL